MPGTGDAAPILGRGLTPDLITALAGRGEDGIDYCEGVPS